MKGKRLQVVETINRIFKSTLKKVLLLGFATIRETSSSVMVQRYVMDPQHVRKSTFSSALGLGKKTILAKR